MLRDTYKTIAREFLGKQLKTLWGKLTAICNIDKSSVATNSSSTVQETNSVEDLLTAFLDNEFNKNHTQNNDVLGKFEKLNLPYVKNANVLRYWQERKHIDPELYSCITCVSLYHQLRYP